MPLSGPQATFDRLTASVARIGAFRYESTVGSAVPVIEATLGLLRAADRVDAVRGALSGTLGFLFTGLQAGGPLLEPGRRGAAAAAIPNPTRAPTWAGWMWRARP